MQGGSILRCTCRPPSLAVNSTTAHVTSGALKKALLRKRRNCQGQGQPDKSRGQGLLGLPVLQDGFMLRGRNPPHHCLSPFSWGKWESSFLSVDITKLLWHQAIWIGVPAVYRNYLGSQALSTRGPWGPRNVTLEGGHLLSHGKRSLGPVSPAVTPPPWLFKQIIEGEHLGRF